MIWKKKKGKGILVIAVSILIVIILFGFFKVIVDNSFYKGKIGVFLPEHSTVLKKEDNHGFHGDGEYYSEIQLTNEGAKEFVNEAKKTGKWFSVPLPKDIKIILYGGEYDSTNYNIGKMSKEMPENINHGMYYIRDRFAEEYPAEKNRNINSRSSWNVTISVLDFDTNILYIYELDT